MNSFLVRRLAAVLLAFALGILSSAAQTLPLPT